MFIPSVASIRPKVAVMTPMRALSLSPTTVRVDGFKELLHLVGIENRRQTLADHVFGSSDGVSRV